MELFKGRLREGFGQLAMGNEQSAIGGGLILAGQAVFFKCTG